MYIKDVCSVALDRGYTKFVGRVRHRSARLHAGRFMYVTCHGFVECVRIYVEYVGTYE